MNLKEINFNKLIKSIVFDNYDQFVENAFNYSSILNESNLKGETLLHYCSFYGLIDKYYALINLGCDLKKTNDNNNLLHYACYSGKDPFLIVELVKSNISPIEINNKNYTSLHLVSDEKIAHYLNIWCLRNNIKIKNILDFNGNSVIHSAFQLGHTDTINYWLTQYPDMAELKNNNNELYYQVKKENFEFCSVETKIKENLTI